MERVAVYIDGTNFYGGISFINPKYTDAKFDFERYINNILHKRKLICIKYYNASLKQQITPEIFKKQQKLFSRLRKIPLCEVILSKRKPRFDQEGNQYHTIKGDDIALAIDMLSGAYENKYDTAILISSDGDFTPLLKKIKNIGKRSEVHYFSGCVSFDLLKEANKSTVINKKILRKYFYMGPKIPAPNKQSNSK